MAAAAGSDRPFSSLMMDTCDDGDNEVIDQAWIASHGAFACIWALTHRLGSPAVHETSRNASRNAETVLRLDARK